MPSRTIQPERRSNFRPAGDKFQQALESRPGSRRGLQDPIELDRRPFELTYFDKRASERHPRGYVARMDGEAGPTDCDRLFVAAGPPGIPQRAVQTQSTPGPFRPGAEAFNARAV